MVHDNQKTSPEPPARKTGHKRVKLKSFMDYIDICLAENVRNDEIIFAEIKAMGYTGRRSMPRYYIQPGRKMRPSKRTVRFETQPGYHLSATPGKKLILWLPDNRAPGLTAASLNHAEYQRKALPVKRET